MKRILITGGFGFVGSQLLTYLSNDQVTVIDNLLSGPALSTGANIRFVQGDIRDYQFMRKLVPQHDTIVHLAAIVGEPACVIDPDFAYDVNVKGTHILLESMTPSQSLIFTSTSSVYGNRPNQTVTEESLPIPINNYARHKHLSELDIITARDKYIIFRPVTAFGITQRTRLDLLVNTLIYEALSFQRIEVFEPNIMRPIIHVEDFARILANAVHGYFEWNQIYNIGDPIYSVTKFQLAKLIGKICGADVLVKDGSSLDPRDYDVDFHKLIHTGFSFGSGRLGQAVQQIKSQQYAIAADPDSFSTPSKVKAFLAKESYVHNS